MSANTSAVPGVYRALLQGQYERGTGGVLYVRGELCAYRFVHELPDEKVRARLEEVLQEDEERHFFVLEDKQDGQLHLLAYPRDVVREAVERALEGEEAAAEAPAEAEPPLVEEVVDAEDAGKEG